MCGECNWPMPMEKKWIDKEEAIKHWPSEAAKISKWVPVAESLPPNRQLVLVFMKNLFIHESEGMFLARRLGNEWRQENGDEWHNPSNISHWMDLPEAPDV